MKDSLRFLSELLHKHHGKKAYILVDEYDRPSNALLANVLGSEKNSDDYNEAKKVYIKVSGLVTNILCKVGKTHPEHMEKIIMVGIMDVLKRDGGSGFNNVSTYSILDYKFSGYFGIIQDSDQHKKGELNISFKIE